jgi:hypothetical protein
VKKCSKCKKEKPLNSFYKSVGKKDDRQSWCKECDEKRHKKWRKDHREQVVEMSRLQRERHPEEMRAAVRKYGKAHPEVSRKSGKKWLINNPEKKSAHKKVYYAVRTGKLKKERCFCGDLASAHHEDYNKPLDVMWLCPIHHKERHAKLLKVKL